MRLYGARDHLAPRAALADDQDAAASRSGTLNQVHDQPHRRRGSNNAVGRCLSGLCLRHGGQRGLLASVRNQGFEIARRRRPWQHVEHAGANRVSRCRRPVRVGDADDHSSRMLRSHGARRAQGVTVPAQVDHAERDRFLDGVHHVRALHRHRQVAHAAQQRLEVGYVGLAGHEEGRAFSNRCGNHCFNVVKVPDPSGSASMWSMEPSGR